MSKLLAKYISKDIALNYNNDIVSYLKTQVCYQSIGYFQSAVDALPGQVNRRFKEVVELSKFRDAGSQIDVHGVLLVKALTHPAIKKSVIHNFKLRSIPTTHIASGSLRQLLNSRDLCKFTSIDTTWNLHEIEKHYTGASPVECVDHYIGSIVNAITNGADAPFQSMVHMISTKPKSIGLLSESSVHALAANNIIRLLHALDQPRFIKTVIEKNISFPRETAAAISEHVTMYSMAHDWVSPRATKMLRLLG